MNDIIREIGILTLRFSKLEHLCLRYISVLMSGSDNLENHMIFQNYNLAKKTETLRTLISLKEYGQFEKIQLETLNSIDKLRDLRNKLIHGNWDTQEIDLKKAVERIKCNSIKIKSSSPAKNYKGPQESKPPDKTWSPEKGKIYNNSEIQSFNERIEELILEVTHHIGRHIEK